MSTETADDITSYAYLLHRVPEHVITHPESNRQWWARHVQGMWKPTGPERPVIHMIEAWLDYADYHETAYESNIGADYVLGEAWQRMGRNLRSMLDGELGRLDGGTLDSVICDALRHSGVEDSEI